MFQLLFSSVNRFTTTLQDLTQVVRVSKEQPDQAESIQLEQLLEEIQQDLNPTREETKARFVIQMTCPSVNFSRKNLKSILYNLVSNAMKYRSPERSPIVHISCQTQEDYYVLSVEDNGLGMNEAQRKKVFGLFQRFHTHVEGTGIGLYIVKKIVENAGGKIEVESQEGVGSTFRVYIRITVHS